MYISILHIAPTPWIRVDMERQHNTMGSAKGPVYALATILVFTLTRRHYTQMDGTLCHLACILQTTYSTSPQRPTIYWLCAERERQLDITGSYNGPVHNIARVFEPWKIPCTPHIQHKKPLTRHMKYISHIGESGNTKKPMGENSPPRRTLYMPHTANQ